MFLLWPRFCLASELFYALGNGRMATLHNTTQQYSHFQSDIVKELLPDCLLVLVVPAKRVKSISCDVNSAGMFSLCALNHVNVYSHHGKELHVNILHKQRFLQLNGCSLYSISYDET